MTAQNIGMIYDDANLMDAERLMIERGVRRLLVLRRVDNLVIGVLSVDDIAMVASRVRAGEILRGTAPATTASAGKPPSGGQAPALQKGSEGGQTGFFRPSVYTVGEVIHGGSVEWLSETESCQAAAMKMHQANIGCIPLRSAPTGEQLTGIITDRDLVVRVIAPGLDASRTLVRDIATKDLVSCFDDDNLADAQRSMIERGVRRLLVQKRQTNRVVGILSVDDIALVASRERAGSILRSVAQPAEPRADDRRR